MNDCDEAIDRVMVGPERKSVVMSQREKEKTRNRIFLQLPSLSAAHLFLKLFV